MDTRRGAGVFAYIKACLIVSALIGNLFPPIGGVSLALIATVAASPIIVMQILRNLPKIDPVLPWVAGLFILLSFHAIVIAPSSEYGHEKIGKFLTVTLVSALLATTLRDRCQIRALGNTWAAFALLLAILSILGYDGGRSDVFDSNPIWLARALATGALIMIWLWHQGGVSNFVALPVITVLLVGLAAAGSRGPLIGLFLGYVALIVFSVVGTRRRVIKSTIVLTGASLLVTQLPLFAGSRFSTLLEIAQSDQFRQVFWSISLPSIIDHPGGVGFGNWSSATNAPAAFRYPHNIFLEVLVEQGVIVGMTFVAVVVFVICRLCLAARSNKETLLVLALLVAETTAVSVSGDLNARTFFFLLALGYIYSAPGKTHHGRRQCDSTDTPGDRSVTPQSSNNQTPASRSRNECV